MKQRPKNNRSAQDTMPQQVNALGKFDPEFLMYHYKASWGTWCWLLAGAAGARVAAAKSRRLVAGGARG